MRNECSLLGATFLWTDQVYMFPCMSFVSLEHDASRALIIESTEEAQVRKPGDIVKFEWSPEEWEDYGWEILYPESPSDEQ